MHWVNAETRIGTNIEGPSHYKMPEKEIVKMPLKMFIREAVLVRLPDKKPITPVELMKAGVKQNDIVLP